MTAHGLFYSTNSQNEIGGVLDGTKYKAYQHGERTPCKG